ncbi:MAG TPA: peptidoglycan-binding domain-containing protein [Myxococcota bacterium]|nr:peptidoglycan-binding domain-containing protein [Myxococcota bacterium]
MATPLDPTQSSTQEGRIDAVPLHDAQPKRIKSGEDTTDTAQLLTSARQAVDRYDTTLGAAASGVKTDIDIEAARLRLRDVQTALVGLGYKIGRHDDPAAPIDGTWGPETRDTIAAFQDDHGLDATGQIDGETYEAVLSAYDDALGTRSEVQLQDDFSPIHAEQPLAADDLELMEEPYPAQADDSTSLALELRDDL